MKKIEYYVEDSLNQLLSEAIELKEKATNEFDKGKLFGYYESLSLLLNRAEAFGITEQLPDRVRNFDLETLL